MEEDGFKLVKSKKKKQKNNLASKVERLRIQEDQEGPLSQKEKDDFVR